MRGRQRIFTALFVKASSVAIRVAKERALEAMLANAKPEPGVAR